MGNLEFVVPLKRYTKKTPFCMSSNKFFLRYRYGLQDSYWVGNSLMKTVDSVAFQKRKAMREFNNDESNNFEMEILDEGALNKALKFPESFIRKTPGIQFMSSLTTNTSNNQKLIFQNIFY